MTTSNDDNGPLPVDAVWDIETANWDRFIVGAIWDSRDDTVSVYNDEDNLADHLLSLPPGSTAWAHAGGKFDVLWLLDWCRRKSQIPKAQIRLSGSSIASLAINGGPILRDSARLMPMALKQACTMFPGCAQKQRLDLPCVCGKDCGGYCSISADMSIAHRATLREYLESDVLSLRDTLRSLTEYAANSGLNLAGTVAGTGWSTAKERCGLWDADWSLDSYLAAREGYYGGHCEAGIVKADKVYRFDRTQAYPAALCKPMSVGESALLNSKTAVKAWSRDKPGIYRASVTVPEMMAPPLPIRYRDRIVYPWGKLSGSWSRDELKHALEVGCNITKFHGGVAWEREEALLEPHVRHCFSLREVAKTENNDALSMWLKFVANSLTGAFAQDPEFDIIALGDDYADDPNYEPVGRYDWIWRRGVFGIPKRGHVHWAATLTADARVELHRQIIHAGDDWVYSDTDSCYALRMLTRRVGTGLGEWAYEGEGHNWECLAPKVYAFDGTTKKKPLLHRIAKAKGIPDAADAWPSIAGGLNVTLDRGVDSFLVASRTDSLFRRRSGHRTVKPKGGWCGGRILRGLRTYAPHVSALDSIPR